MTRHLNGVKYPLSQEELRDVVERVESREKFAGRIFVSVSVPIILKVAGLTDPKVTVVTHAEECRCDACIHAYLEAMEKRSAQTLEDMKVALGQTVAVQPVIYVEEEINYVG